VPHTVDARRRDAEHRGADEPLVLGLRHSLLDHAADGPGGVGEDAAGQAVEPDTSTTEYIIVMSLTPTYGPTSPEAMVDTINLGMPTGSACMAVLPMTYHPSHPC